MKRICCIAFLLSVLALQCIAQPQPCRSKVDTADAALNTLRTLAPSATNPNEKECIKEAISVLASLRYGKSIPELIRYLSFHTPPEWPNSDVLLLHSYVEGGNFPATVALAQMGEPARSALLTVIKSITSSTLERQNAAHAILLSFMYEERPDAGKGILYLRNLCAGA